jgi:hypothetical protein
VFPADHRTLRSSNPLLQIPRSRERRFAETMDARGAIPCNLATAVALDNN